MQAAVQKSKGSNSNNNNSNNNNKASKAACAEQQKAAAPEQAAAAAASQAAKKTPAQTQAPAQAAQVAASKDGAAKKTPAAAPADTAQEQAAPAPAQAAKKSPAAATQTAAAAAAAHADNNNNKKNNKGKKNDSSVHVDPAESAKAVAAVADGAAVAQDATTHTAASDEHKSNHTGSGSKIDKHGSGDEHSAPASVNNRSAAAAEQTSKTAGSTSHDDEQQQQQQQQFPTPAPVDWSESRLPELFDCHNTAAMATTCAIPLHTAWDLYADDHNGPNGLASAAAGGGGGGAAPMHGLGLAAPPSSGTLSFDAVHITTVADVQTFWRVWRYVTPPSACPIPYTYSWFRKDIKPEWEHARNKKGGMIVLVVFDRDRPGLNDKQALDDVFMAALLGAIGESFAESTTTLNGIMLKLRPNKPVTLHVWTAHSESGKLKAFANSLRATLGKILGAKALQKIEYFSHHQNNQAHSGVGGMGSLAARMKPKPKTTPDYTF